MTTAETATPSTDDDLRAVTEKLIAWAATLMLREQFGLAALLAPRTPADGAEVAGYALDLDAFNRLFNAVVAIQRQTDDAKRTIDQNIR